VEERSHKAWRPSVVPCASEIDLRRIAAMKNPLTEEHRVREALKRRLHTEHGDRSDTLVIEELGLRHGLARVNLAVVNGSLHGFEIKSGCDRLTRLPTQARVFSEVLDGVTLVLAERHVDGALQIVPEWWGLLTATCVVDQVVFSELRKAGTNPAPDQVALAKLLWRDEALAFLRAVGHAEGYGAKPRAAIYARLAIVTTRSQLRTRVRDCLLSRSDWRSDARQTSCGD
jgi:hypothetical protein